MVDLGTGESVADCVVTPPDYAQLVAARYRMAPGERLRIAFHGGPGDVAGSFDHWMAGAHDSRVPVIAYSTQFYSLVERIGAEALLLTEPPEPPRHHHPHIRFKHVARDRQAGGLDWRREQIRYARRILAEIRAFRPHIAIMGTDFPFWTYGALPRGTGLILTMHNTFWPMGQPGSGLRARLQRLVAGYGLRRAAAAVCTSPECARQLGAITGRHEGLFVEMPQMPVAHLPERRERITPRKLLFLGRMEENKGIFDLLSAFCSLAAQRPDISLTYAGEGAAAAALQTAIAAVPMHGRVHFAGHLSAAEVRDALQKADLLICPTRSSFNEGLALVVIEAAAAGVPSVASSVVPARELVTDACTVFPADDVAALERTIGGLLDDPVLFAARAAGTAQARDRVQSRELSWGSQLARAILHRD